MPEDPSLHETSFTIHDAARLRGRFLLLGLINILLGMAAFIVPAVSEYPVEVVIGLILMAAGAADGVHAFLLRSKFGYMLSLISSFTFLFVGGLLVFSPVSDFTSLYMAVAMMFWIGGVLRMGKGIDIRPVNSWPWVVSSGLLSLIFGFFILAQGHDMTFKLLDILVGISLIVDGWSRMIVFWIHEK